MAGDRDERLSAAMRDAVALIAPHLGLDASLELWDGTRLPLGEAVTRDLAIRIAAPGVVASLLKPPSLDKVIRHYAHGDIEIVGGTLIDLAGPLALDGAGKRLKGLKRGRVLKALLPFLTVGSAKPGRSRGYGGDALGRARGKAENRDFIKFHYDVGNDFYALFLDPEMVYSCAYFTTWEGSLERAQVDKLEMICRKLRLAPGERFLDIGCGWGGLVCHAAQHHGVRAHGITLSDEQLAFAREKVRRLGLADRVSLEIRDYADLEGEFDKIASIGMYEHIGLKNVPRYMATAKRLLAPGGLFLNHAIARRVSRSGERFATRPEQKAILKYIFPGGELDDIGSTVHAMEKAGFEVHDVEAWREHYARTTRLWCERLHARRAEAEKLAGPETTRIWLAYLAGVSLAFTRGSLRIYQTLVSRQRKGASPHPPTRADLYR